MKIHMVLGGTYQELFENQIQEEDLVIGVDRGAWRLAKNHYRMDLAIGDFDSVSASELKKIKTCAQLFEQFPSEKDDTDTELALDWAVTHFPEATIKMYCWNGGRIDHLMSIMYLVYQDRFRPFAEQLQLIDAQHVVQFYKAGQHVLQKLTDFQYLSIITMTPVDDLTIQGAKYELASTTFDYPRALISNEFIAHQTVQVSFSKGLLVVIHSRD